MNHESEQITVEVAYALPDRQMIIPLNVARGTTAYEAVVKSGIVEKFPDIDIDNIPMGIFSHPLGAKGLPPATEYQLKEWDRIEIYRPLIADPKEVRKQRAAKAKGKR